MQSTVRVVVRVRPTDDFVEDALQVDNQSKVGVWRACWMQQHAMLVDAPPCAGRVAHSGKCATLQAISITLQPSRSRTLVGKPPSQLYQVRCGWLVTHCVTAPDEYTPARTPR